MSTTYKVKTLIHDGTEILHSGWQYRKTDRDVFKMRNAALKAAGREATVTSTGFARDSLTGRYGAFRYAAEGKSWCVTLWIVREYND